MGSCSRGAVEARRVTPHRLVGAMILSMHPALKMSEAEKSVMWESDSVFIFDAWRGTVFLQRRLVDGPRGNADVKSVIRPRRCSRGRTFAYINTLNVKGAYL